MESAAKLFDCLETAAKMVAHFQQQHGREPTDVELRVAMSLFIEAQKGAAPKNGNGGYRGGGGQRQGGGSKVAPQGCPNCGGPMWDNRESKRNPKAPDFKCKNKEHCDGAVWVNAQQRPPQRQPAPDVPPHWDAPDTTDRMAPWD